MFVGCYAAPAVSSKVSVLLMVAVIFAAAAAICCRICRVRKGFVFGNEARRENEHTHREIPAMSRNHRIAERCDFFVKFLF